MKIDLLTVITPQFGTDQSALRLQPSPILRLTHLITTFFFQTRTQNRFIKRISHIRSFPFNVRRLITLGPINMNGHIQRHNNIFQFRRPISRGLHITEIQHTFQCNRVILRRHRTFAQVRMLSTTLLRHHTNNQAIPILRRSRLTKHRTIRNIIQTMRLRVQFLLLRRLRGTLNILQIFHTFISIRVVTNNISRATKHIRYNRLPFRLFTQLRGLLPQVVGLTTQSPHAIVKGPNDTPRVQHQGLTTEIRAQITRHQFRMLRVHRQQHISFRRRVLLSRNLRSQLQQRSRIVHDTTNLRLHRRNFITIMTIRNSFSPNFLFGLNRRVRQMVINPIMRGRFFKFNDLSTGYNRTARNRAEGDRARNFRFRGETPNFC